MFGSLRKMGLAAVIVLAIAGTTVAVPDVANARWGGGWHGGGWHGGGGFGWGGFGVGVGTGLLLGAATAPYWGYYGGPYAYDYGYGPYAYDSDYAPGYAAYGGGCFTTRRWVINSAGHHVWRRVRVCR